MNQFKNLFWTILHSRSAVCLGRMLHAETATRALPLCLNEQLQHVQIIDEYEEMKNVHKQPIRKHLHEAWNSAAHFCQTAV